MLSGCILYDYYEKVKNILESPPRYEWVKTVQVEDKFGWLDIVNEDMAKSSDYPLFLKNGTKYLHIYIKVDFSNPINPDFEILSHGKFNITIILYTDMFFSPHDYQ